MEDTPENRKRVFISYSRRDADFAEKLAKDLRARGVGVWFDRLDIPPGANWDDEIEAALRVSDTMVVVLSPDSVESKNVRDEVSFALADSDRIVPVMCRECSPPLRVARLQWIDLEKNYAEGLEQLVTRLQSEPTSAGERADSLSPTRRDATDRKPGRSPAIKLAAPLAAAAVALGAVALVVAADDDDDEPTAEVAAAALTPTPGAATPASAACDKALPRYQKVQTNAEYRAQIERTFSRGCTGTLYSVELPGSNGEESDEFHALLGELTTTEDGTQCRQFTDPDVKDSATERTCVSSTGRWEISHCPNDQGSTKEERQRSYDACYAKPPQPDGPTDVEKMVLASSVKQLTTDKFPFLKDVTCARAEWPVVVGAKETCTGTTQDGSSGPIVVTVEGVKGLDLDFDIEVPWLITEEAIARLVETTAEAKVSVRCPQKYWRSTIGVKKSCDVRFENGETGTLNLVVTSEEGDVDIEIQ